MDSNKRAQRKAKRRLKTFAFGARDYPPPSPLQIPKGIRGTRKRTLAGNPTPSPARRELPVGAFRLAPFCVAAVVVEESEAAVVVGTAAVAVGRKWAK